ncbi:MAG: acylphosphatase [Cytophagaceae bacterium]
MKHYTIKVFGRVQGVNFRASAREKAEDLGLAGIVRNMQDGTVYMEVEGSEGLLETLVAWCRKGPLLAKVDKVEVKEKDLKHYERFKIER